MNTKGLLSKRSKGEAVCLRFILVFVFICLSICSAVAQSGGAQLDVEKLIGCDPESIINHDNHHRVYPNSQQARDFTFLLFNVGAQKFFNIGGSYGRHASLSDYGMYLWIFQNSNTSGAFNIRTLQNYVAKDFNNPNGIPDNKDSYVQYIEKDQNKPGVYLECNPTDANYDFGWIFEKAKGYDETTNKVYKIRTYGNRYLTATPNDPDGNFCEATTNTPENPNYQVWKLITVAQYYKLLDESPSDLSAPVDVTFKLQNPEFNYNKTNAAHWATSGDSHYVRYGVEDYYKKATEDYYKGDSCNIKYLYENGRYFCADIKDSHPNVISQGVNVSKPGWYIFRCNGFSNTNGLAKLFVTNAQGFYLDNVFISTTPLNPLEKNGPKDLLAAGKAFYNGRYENQVMIHVSQEDIDGMGGAETLVFGIKIEGDKNTSASGEWTAFDNFRMLYAGEYEAPSLVLDEDNPDLLYLTETMDEYKNTVLHLKRTFTLNKWNTIILPVAMNYGQMKSTFGDEVLLAELYSLTPQSVRFKTVDCQKDEDPMLEAFTPYIIKPTKNAGQNHSYTTPRLKKADNQFWLDENEGITNTEDGVTRYTSGNVTVAENHYDISGISLDRNLLKANIDKHWVSTTTTSTSDNASNNAMLCKGTLAKTYYIKDGKGYFYTDGNEKRDNLAGDYFLKGGTMYKVPNGQVYGLKAFRCWFELPNTESGSGTTAPAKQVKLFINDIEENATGIEDVMADQLFAQPKNEKPDGIYNLNGQRLRNTNSLEGLPKGIYIVKGKMVSL